MATVKELPLLSKLFLFGPDSLALPKTNMAPENGWLGNYFHFGKAYFQVPC